MTNDHLLFVYGTLLLADNEFARYLKNNSTFYSAGTIKGRLYDLGEYPGVITGTTGDYDIKGSVVKLTSADALKIIDDYEGYGNSQPLPYLYLRKKLLVTTADGVIDCWVYVYNLSVEGLMEIVGGDYLAHKHL